MGRFSYAWNLTVTALDYIRQGTQRLLLRVFGSRGRDDSKVNFRYRLALPGEVVPFNVSNTDKDEVVHAKCLRDRQIDLEVFTEALRDFLRLSRRYGFAPVVTYIPSAHTTYAATVVFDQPALSDLMPWFSRAQRSYFKTKATELGYVFVDLTPALQAAAAANGIRNLLYDPVNLHLTQRGHAVVAEALSGAIRSSAVALQPRP